MAGEIAAGVGLKDTTTGDTLSAENAPIILESMTFPDPVISVAVEPKSKGDQDKLGANPVPIQIPIGQEDQHVGVVDLVEMQAIVYKDDLGQEFYIVEIPAELAEQAHEYHHQLIDTISHFDDEVLQAYIDDESSVTPEMIKRAVRIGTLADEITPVLLGSAFKNKGVQPLLDAVIDYLPSPLYVPAVQGIVPKTEA